MNFPNHPLSQKMATSCSTKLPRLLHFFIITVLLSQIIPFATPLSFNFSRFSPQKDDNMAYDRAYPDRDGVILLVDKLDAAGRATYNKNLRLWDNTTGNLTDFTTHFSFVIDSRNQTAYADGMAFFLAPQGSVIPTLRGGGGAFGLTKEDEPLNSTSNPFVAVEFDIFHNEWDPFPNNRSDHVGIDINSMNSSKYESWLSNIRLGQKNEAWISYNSSTQNLSVDFTGFRNNVTVMQHLDYKIDLRLYFPDELVTFGFSASTGDLSAIFRIYSWEFNSSLEVDDNSNNPTQPSDSNPVSNSRRRRKNRTGLAIGLSIGGGVLVGGLVLIWLAGIGRKRDEDDEEDKHIFDELMDGEFEKGTGPKKFPYKELAGATNNFNDEQKLGEGGFGGVYKGFLRESNSYVAVKKVSKESKQGIKEYASEVKIISKLRHRNLVKLLGWCHEKKKLLLVYEYMPNGSLDFHLYKENSLLTWEMRYKIAQDLASGLLYLHEEWEECVVHRDIKSSNVMLDSNFNAKIGDFGLARLVEHAKGSQTTVVAGTMGYMAPEYVITGKASKESDVYSFGIVALEIACGRKPINQRANEGQVHTVQWIWELYGNGKLLEAADPRLCEEFDKKQMQVLMVVGLWCAHPDYNLRPSIRQVIHVLNSEARLPVLPPKMPVLTSLSPAMNMPMSVLSISCGAIYTEGDQNLNLSSSYNDNFNSISSQFTSSSAASSSASLLNSS